MKFFDAIIVEPDIGARERLKLATTALPEFRKVVPVKSFNECVLNYSRTRPPWDVVFVTFRLGRQEALAFCAEARSFDSFQDCAFILVLKSNDVSDSDIATSVAGGVDGLLCEPFSAEGLRECTKIAIMVKVNNGKQRVKVALGVVIPLMLKMIETKSALIANEAMEKDIDTSDPALKYELDNLQATCGMIKEISQYAGRSYEDIIREIFKEFEDSTAHRRQYSGPSKRIQMKFEVEARLCEKIKKDLIAMDASL